MDTIEVATYAAHLYTCDQRVDLCYRTQPREGQTWHEFAVQRASHVATILTTNRKG